MPTPSGMTQTGTGTYVNPAYISEAGKQQAASYATPTVVAGANVNEKYVPEANKKLADLTKDRTTYTGQDGNTYYNDTGEMANKGATDSTASDLLKLYGGTNTATDTTPEDAEIANILKTAKSAYESDYNQQVQNIQDKYAGLKTTLQKQQVSTNAGVQQALLLGGGAEFAPVSSAGVMDAKFAANAQDLSNLQQEENNLISQAQSAKSAKDFQLLEATLKQVENKRKEKQDLAKTVNDEISAQLKAVREAKVKAEEDFAKEKSTVLLALSKANNVPADVFNKVKQATNIDELYTSASGHMITESDILDTQYKKAQIAKIYSDINEAKATGGGDPAQIIAYASQYSSTGKIPTGIPKGSFGTIAAVAKELPKTAGQIIDTRTGVAPDAADSTIAAYGSLYSAIELAKQLKELDKNRWDGIIAGTVGKVFGSDDQQRYVDLRSQIVDLLSRARSGAALTPSEEKRYGDMLPGRFATPLGLGVETSSRIDNFTNALTSDLTNKASVQGWAVNGISKIKINNQEYTIGDVISNGKGQKGRVNADGSITLIQ